MVALVAGPVPLRTGGVVVAVDAVGAGEGEFVLYASGSSARQTQVTDGKPVDVRLLASTTRDLHAMIEERQFRPDLVYARHAAYTTAPLRAASIGV